MTKSMHRLQIMAAIGRERDFQDEKYGPVLTEESHPQLGNRMTQGEGGHQLAAWLLVIEKELNEAKAAATGKGIKELTGRHSCRSEILQIAAVCVAALEQHGVEE